MIQNYTRIHLLKGVTLLKPGSMLPERTTTTGDSLPVMHINPFHMISADVTIIPETVPRPLAYGI